MRVRSSFVGGPFDGPEDLGMLERCISRSVPASMIPVMYGNNYQIIQTPGYIVITYEIVHEARVIPLDGRPHVGSSVRAHMGDPRGRWEGNSLVVETTNFTSAAAYRNANADTLRVIERFTRVSPDRIEWTATLDDPQPGRGPGRLPCRSRPIPIRSWPSSATSTITDSETSSARLERRIAISKLSRTAETRRRGDQIGGSCVFRSFE